MLRFPDTAPELTTPRLRLRAFLLVDAPAVNRLVGNLAVARMTCGIPHPYDLGQAEDWIRRQSDGYTERRYLNRAVVEREGERLVGCVGLTFATDSLRAELGYWIGEPYWGRGYCTEAARALLAWGFEVLGLERVTSSYYACNPASGRVMEKLGMRREGLRRRQIRRFETWHDLIETGILREEWSQSG